MRLINADELQMQIDEYAEHIRRLKKGKIPKAELAVLLDCKACVDNAPTVDAVPVVHGKWVKLGRWGRVYRCDQCGNYLDFDGVNVGRGDANYCPNCGADMRGEQDE